MGIYKQAYKLCKQANDKDRIKGNFGTFSYDQGEHVNQNPYFNQLQRNYDSIPNNKRLPGVKSPKDIANNMPVYAEGKAKGTFEYTPSFWNRFKKQPDWDFVNEKQLDSVRDVQIEQIINELSKNHEFGIDPINPDSTPQGRAAKQVLKAHSRHNRNAATQGYLINKPGMERTAPPINTDVIKNPHLIELLRSYGRTIATATPVKRNGIPS